MTRSSQHARKIPKQILKKIESQRNLGQQCLAVFDLDSTLFDVSPRLLRILLDFAATPEYQKKFPEQIQLFKNIRTERQDWGIQNALERVGLDRHHPEFLEAVHDFWHERFFANEYLEYDLPYDGAVEYVNNIVSLGAEVAYLTGRDIPRMGAGTALVLKKWGFPLDDQQVQLILKPNKTLDDAEFKTNYFEQLPEGKYANIWFFENEPMNIHHLRHRLPEVEVIFFHSTHAGKAAPPEDIPRIMHFLLDETEDG